MTEDPSSDRDAAGDRQARYAGEDTRLTSTKELAGWYMYSFAAETYVLCGALSPMSRTLRSRSRDKELLDRGATVTNVEFPAAV